MKQFSYEIFHNGEVFLEAAKRCRETRPGEATGQPNALLFPAEHCAIIACEMFLKAISATPSEIPDRLAIVRTWAGDNGHVNQALVARQLGSEIGRKAQMQLTSADVAEITALSDRFTQSRYPYERSTTRPEADKALILAEKLYYAVKAAIAPDASGNIQLG
jgi:hypothetical protein